MKQKQPTTAATPTEDDVRDYAYHLYCQGGCAPGHQLENWLEAEACLGACIPKEHAHARLHRHTHREPATVLGPSREARVLAIA